MDQTFENLKDFLAKAFADKNGFTITYTTDPDNSTNASFHMKYAEAGLQGINEEGEDTILVADTNRILNAVERLGNDYEVGDPVIMQRYNADTSEVMTDFTIEYFS